MSAALAVLGVNAHARVNRALEYRKKSTSWGFIALAGAATTGALEGAPEGPMDREEGTNEDRYERKSTRPGSPASSGVGGLDLE